MDPIRYFEKKAVRYHERSEGGFWQRLRGKEGKAVFALLAPDEGERILDAGCGTGYYAARIGARGAKVTGIDASDAMAKKARERGLDVRPGLLESFALEERFDKILCAGALEFCADPGKAVANCAAHLKDGGIMVILVPRVSVGGVFYKLFHALHGLKIRLFRIADIETMCAEAGLTLMREEIRTPAFSLVAKAKK